MIPKANEPSQIGEIVAGFLKQGDIDGIITMFHPECVIHFPPGEPPKKGHDGVREVFEGFIPMKPTLTSNVTGVVINGDDGMVQATWKVEDQSGNLIAEGKSSEQVKKLDGGWVYYIDCPLGLPSTL